MVGCCLPLGSIHTEQKRRRNYSLMCDIFLPPATKLRQGNVFTPDCHSADRGEWQTPLGRHPPEQTSRRSRPPWQQTPPWSRHSPFGSRPPPGSRHPPGADPPPRSRHPPPAQCMLGDTCNKRVVRILLENILVFDFFLFCFRLRFCSV